MEEAESTDVGCRGARRGFLRLQAQSARAALRATAARFPDLSEGGTCRVRASAVAELTVRAVRGAVAVEVCGQVFDILASLASVIPHAAQTAGAVAILDA